MTIEHKRKMALEYDMPAALQNCLLQLSENALFVSLAAMDRGETDTAMELLETGLKARLERQSTLVGGQATNWRWIHPVHGAAAATAGRDDLIRLAAATESKALEQISAGLDEPTKLPDLSAQGITVSGLMPYEDQMQRHKASLQGRLDHIAEQRDRLLESLKLIDVYQSVRDIAAAEPGIRQTELATRLPAPFVKRTSTLVNQLEAAKQVVTAKDGSRVTVWPAGHPDLPSSLRVVSRPWTFTDVDAMDDPDALPALEEEALKVVGWAQNLASVIRSGIETPDDPQSIRIQDFIGYPMGPAESEGRLCNMDDEWRELTVWGHVPLDVPAAIVARFRETPFSRVKARSMKRWLTSTPRHTYVVAVPGKARRVGVSRPILKEVKGPCPGAIPVTVLENAADPSPAVVGTTKRMLWRWEAENRAASEG